MEERRNAPKMNLRMLENQSRKDKFVDTTWRKAALYDKHRSSPLRRNLSYPSSASDLEAETAFKVERGHRNVTKSHALGRAYDRSISPSKRISPANRIKRVKRTGKINCKISSSLSSYKIYRCRRPSSSGYLAEDGCEAVSSSELSCNSSSSTSGHKEEIDISSIPYHECYDKAKDSMHESGHANQENERAFSLQLKNIQFQDLKTKDYCGKKKSEAMMEIRSLNEDHIGFSQMYRPKSFKELAGQKIVKKSLMNAILKQKIAPLYLFYGPRGTGKKSAARIFASALNCLSPNIQSRPCCKCKECCLYFSGKSPHVTELNASGIEGFERLNLCLESVQFSCLTSGYRIYIIQDCHELTSEAWSNAFLKRIENVVGRVVFILITINLERVPKTALSRIHKFCFQKLTDADVFNRLKKLAVEENIDIEEDALHLIAARAGGSLRDAETVLEKFRLLSSKVTLSRVREMVGLIPVEKLLDLLDFAMSADTENTLKCTRQIIHSGVKPLAIVSQLATLVMDILAKGCVSANAQETLNIVGGHYSSRDGTEKLVRALKILAEAEKQLRASNECISWLTAALLQLGSEDMKLNPHSSINTLNIFCQKDVAKLDPPQADEACQHSDYWNVYDVPHKFLSAPNIEIIEAKEPEIRDSCHTRCGLAGSSMTPIVQSHETKSKTIPLQVQYCPIKARHADLNPVSPNNMEEIWQNVLKSSQPATLEDLLQGQGKLVSLQLSTTSASFIAHVEFNHYQHPMKTEKLKVSISSALQNVLGCPVEVKMIESSSFKHDHSKEATNSSGNNKKHKMCCPHIKSICCNNIARCILVMFQKHMKRRKQRKLGLLCKCASCINSSCLSAKRCLCMES